MTLIFERKGCGFSPAYQAWAPVNELLILPCLGPWLWTLSVKKVLCKHQRSQAALQCLMTVNRFPLSVVVHTGIHEEGGKPGPFL